MATEGGGVVNSNAYWNRRFREDWISNSGREQTAFFAHVAMEAFPVWFHDYLSQSGRSICDMGCALGQASDLFAQTYPQSTVTGVDFSEEAITCAQARKGRVHFETGNIASYSTPHDVFFCSNTLEHFTDPQPLIEQMCRVARDYVVVVVPFWDTLGATSEHEAFFGETMFASHVPDWMKLAHGAVIDCHRLPETRWKGYQALMILERVAEPPPKTYDEPNAANAALPGFPLPSAFQTGRMVFDLPSTCLETSFLRGAEASRALVV